MKNKVKQILGMLQQLNAEYNNMEELGEIEHPESWVLEFTIFCSV